MFAVWWPILLPSGCTLQVTVGQCAKPEEDARPNADPDAPIPTSPDPPGTTPSGGDTGDTGESPVHDTSHTDVLVQEPHDAIDILWVIDNSMSMTCTVGCHAVLTEGLAEQTGVFMDYLGGLDIDYHVGVVTTDTDNPEQSGRLQAALGHLFVDATTPDPATVLAELVSQGADGSGQERGLGATYLALEELVATDNAGFLRDDAALKTIVFSNESDATSPTVITQPDFVTWYKTLENDPGDLTFDSVVCTAAVGDECPATAVGTDYLDTTASVGGVTWDISNDDWVGLMDLLGQQSTGLTDEFFLTQLPVVETLDVTVETPDGVDTAYVLAVGDPPVGDHIYDADRNSITFLSYLPEDGSEVSVTYDLATPTPP